MSLIRLAALGAVGYAGYKYFMESNRSGSPAFASGEADDENFSKVRNAGAESMADKPRNWSDVDERSDESFPASDPPATY